MPPRTALTGSQVIEAALQIIDAEGLEALTMRRLGQSLDRNPMVLYRHAASRDALLDQVVAHVFSLLVVPEPREAWTEVLRTTAHRFRAIALEHPRVVPLLAIRPLATPLGLRPAATLRPLERLLDVLHGAGFSGRDSLHVYRAFSGLLIGHVLTELQELVAEPDETDAVLRLGLQHLPAREFPNVRALADDLASYDGAAELDRAVTILLTGLDTQLHPRPPEGGTNAPGPDAV